MCRVLEETYREGIIDAAKKLKADGTLSDAKIAEILGLSLELVESL